MILKILYNKISVLSRKILKKWGIDKGLTADTGGGHDPTIYLTGLVLSYLHCPSLVGLFTGCLTHIFLDMFNPSGVPFLFGAKRLRLAKLFSGSRESVILTWLCTAIVIVSGISLKLLQI